MSESTSNLRDMSCRVCFDSEMDKYVSLLDNNWAKKFEYCIDIKIAPRQPSILCENCAIKLNDFYIYKTLCHKAQKKWRRIRYREAENQVVIEPLLYSLDNVSQGNINYSQSPFVGSYLVEASENETVKVDEEPANEPVKEPSERNIQIEEMFKEEEMTSIEKDSSNAETVDSSTSKSWKKQKLVCEECGRGFLSENAYNTHLKTQHNDKLSFDCGLCNFESKSFKVVCDHLDSEHFNKDCLICQLCKFTGRDLADMESHRIKHQKPKTIKRCHTCRQLCSNALSLQYHYRKDHLNETGGWCMICDKKYNTFKSFRNHVRLHKESGYTCDHCGIRFLFRQQLVEHLDYHFGQKIFVCDICGKEFKRGSYLKVHQSNVHTEENPVQCTHCNRKYKSKVHLEHHLKEVKSSKPFTCALCGSEFSSMKKLDAHEFFHTGVKPFECDVCDKSFKTKSYLKVHMMNHVGIKKYKCSHCEKGFASTYLVKRHESIHTGLRLYTCDLCDKSFNLKKRYVEHVAAQHKGIK